MKVYLALFLLLGILKPAQASEEADVRSKIANHALIADFRVKEAERNVSEEFFWRYPMTVPKAEFPIVDDLGFGSGELDPVPGQGRPVEHMNMGRIYFFQNKFEDAGKTWLTARARYGTTYPMHRRNDYFIALSFLNLARFTRLRLMGELEHAKMHHVNAATFLSWAFMKKVDLQDDFLDKVTPRSLYALSTIYYQYNRFAGAFGAANAGLNFLRRTGRIEFRTKLQRMLTENWIRSGDYLKAIQELDALTRQETDLQEIASAFVRIGDIYFDLNNYELAEDIYTLSALVFQFLKKNDGTSLIFRGESLFWLGQFQESQNSINLGLKTLLNHEILRPELATLMSWGSLRLADGYLALMRKEKNEDAMKKLREQSLLSYFRTKKDFPNSEAAKLAEIRMACLDLPYYQGQNIKHARDLLSSLRKSNLDRFGVELAGACETLSYAKDERTEEMVNRIREFAKEFPQSQFLHQFSDPIKEVRVKDLRATLKNEGYHEGINLYETNQKLLFENIDEKTKAFLFRAYVEIFQSEKAKPFLESVIKYVKKNIDWLRLGVFLAETKTNDPQLLEKILAQIKKTTWDDSLINNRDLLIRRLITSGADEHMEWIFDVRASEASDDADLICDEVMPIMMRLAEKSLAQSLIQNYLNKIMDEQFTQNFKLRKNCMESLFDLEAQNQDFQKSYLAWLKRLSWPLDETTIGHFWLAAEGLSQMGDHKNADILYKHIVEKAPKEFSESRLAKFRLDKSKTEFESLWESP